MKTIAVLLTALFVPLTLFPQSQPTGLKCVNVTSSSATLSWDSQSNGVKFQLRVSNGLIKSNAKPPYEVTGLSSETQYTWQVTSYKGNDISDGVTVDGPPFRTSALPTAKPVPPTVQLTVGFDSVVFAFIPVTDAVLYSVSVFDKQNSGTLIGSGSTVDADQPVVVKGLDSNTKYYFEATLTIQGVASEPTKGDFTTEKMPAVPAPTVTCFVQSRSAMFSFTSAAGATLYAVTIYDKPNGKNIVGMGSTHDASMPIEVTGLESDTRYYFDATITVRGVTSEHAQGDFTTDKEPPMPAPEVACTTQSNLAIFNFAEYSQASLYSVTVFDKSNEKRIVGTGNAADASTPVEITGLEAATRYYYEATVMVSKQTSEPASGSFTTQMSSVNPPPPPSVTVTVRPGSATMYFAGVPGGTFDVRVGSKHQLTENVIERTTTDTSVVIPGLESKTKYYYQATVTVGTMTSEPTNGQFTTTRAALPSPQISCTVQANAATFVFANVQDATLYSIVVYDKQNNGTIVGAGSASDTVSPIIVTGLLSKTKYYFDGSVTVDSTMSETAKGTFTTAKSPKPASPRVDCRVEATSAAFAFTPISGATAYDVRVFDKQNNGTIVGGGSMPDASREIVVSGLESRTKYFYIATVVTTDDTSEPATGSFVTNGTSTSVQRMDAGIPQEFLLGQNYPNPFNPTTTIEFSLPRSSSVRLTIVSLLGVTVQELVQGYYGPGHYHTIWNATGYPSGVYFCHIETDQYTNTKRMILAK